MEKEKLNQYDVLNHLEQMVRNLNNQMAERNRSLIKRYPISFALSILFAFSLVSEGLKGLLVQIGFLREKPLLMLILGIVILSILGVLYRKLDK